MDLFDGMLSFQLLFLAIAGACLAGSTFLRVTDGVAKAQRIRTLDVSAGLLLFVGVLTPLTIPYSWHSGVESLCPRCGPSFNAHVQAIAGDAVGLSAAGFFSSHMLYTLIHLPPSLFRPVHYMMLDKVGQPNQHDDLQTLRLVMRACSLLPPLFLGIPLAVLYHLVHFVHVDLGFSFTSLSRDHLYAFVQVIVFFFGPICACLHDPATPRALWVRYVSYICLYYAPLLWRGLYESCTFEPATSWYYPMEWDGEIETMFAAGGSWLTCFCFTWMPTNADQLRGLLRGICLLIAEIVLTTVTLKGLIHYVFAQQEEMTPLQASGPGVFFKLPPPRPMSPDPRSRLGQKLRTMNKAPPETPASKAHAAARRPKARATMAAIASGTCLLVACFGCYMLSTTSFSECQLRLWCAANADSSACRPEEVAEVCSEAQWPSTGIFWFLGVLSLVSAVVGVLCVFLAFKGNTTIATPMLSLWTIIMSLEAMGTWVIYLLAESFASSICINDSFGALLDPSKQNEQMAASFLVDSSCENRIKQQYLERTWAVFIFAAAAAVGVALMAKQLIETKKEFHVPPQL